MPLLKPGDHVGNETASLDNGDNQSAMGGLSGGKEPTADSGVNVEDFLLPRTLTQRLAKGVLPPNTSIHRDALLAITKAATVFVSYLSSHANEETDKKTIAPQDVLSALKEIEFESFRPRLERELAVYTEAAVHKRRSKNEKQHRGKENVKDKSDVNDGDDGPSIKRLKRDGGADMLEKENQDNSRDPEGTSTARSRENKAHNRKTEQQVDDSEGESIDDPDDGDEGYDEEGDENDDEGEDEADIDEDDDEEDKHSGESEDDRDMTDAGRLSEDILESDSTRRKKHLDLDSNSDSDSD
ncbi:histone H3/H4 domain-containing protein [Emydomyces testavorans]|uniref:DNA polymerase epsilon subunit D n=1 Tax=Emydomyces testavorans TaxID=2070801 RepID=A0AAF0DN43_9EURO|nr:histone H3/H4 domain-containing protein [Emydomyces testavorans]